MVIEQRRGRLAESVNACIFSPGDLLNREAHEWLYQLSYYVKVPLHQLIFGLVRAINLFGNEERFIEVGKVFRSNFST